MVAIKRAGRASRARRGRPASGDQPRDQKVTARFTAQEFDEIAKLGGQRKEKLSSLVRDLVLGTIDEVRGDLRKRRR